MKLCRYEEEEQQVISEMTSFLLYFKDIILPQLHHSATGKYEHQGSNHELVAAIVLCSNRKTAGMQ